MAKKTILKKLKILDYILIFLCVCIAGISLFFALQNRGGGAKLIVSSPYNEWIYRLDEDQILEFEGALGITHITIEGGQAFFAQSPCDNQTCTLSYPVQKNGDWAACLPNQIFIRVEGEDNTESVQNIDKNLDVVGF